MQCYHKDIVETFSSTFYMLHSLSVLIIVWGMYLMVRDFAQAHMVEIRMPGNCVHCRGHGAGQVEVPCPLQPADHLASLYYYVLYLSSLSDCYCRPCGM